MRGFFALPGLIWLFVFFFLPMSLVVLVSFAHLDAAGQVAFFPLSLNNYRNIVDPVFASITLRSARYALLATLCALVLGYPFAWFVARRPRRWQRNLLLLALMVPFFANALARIYGWFILLRSEGWLATLVSRILGPTPLLNTELAIVLGMTYAYLPFMVFPLYSSLERIDANLLLASQDLGATPWQTFTRIVLPLSLPGVVGGSLLVMVPSLCEFVIPKLLGGSKMSTLGTVIEDQFLGRLRLDWPQGGATTSAVIVLIIAVFVLAGALRRMGARHGS